MKTILPICVFALLGVHHLCEAGPKENRLSRPRCSKTEDCLKGYERNNPDSCCADIDECQRGTHDCPDDSTCFNTQGSFTCVCNNGNEPSQGSNSCKDINECQLGTDNCPADSTCTNTEGGFTCPCNSGYVSNGATCRQIQSAIGLTSINRATVYACMIPEKEEPSHLDRIIASADCDSPASMWNYRDQQIHWYVDDNLCITAGHEGPPSNGKHLRLYPCNDENGDRWELQLFDFDDDGRLKLALYPDLCVVYSGVTLNIGHDWLLVMDCADVAPERSFWNLLQPGGVIDVNGNT